MGASSLEIKYPYAFDEAGNLVSIASISKESRYNHTYTCPSCGGKMVPCLGDIKAHYFAHENKKCGKETYLHQTAKQVIADKFKRGDLILSFCPTAECDKPCEHHDEDMCVSKVKRSYNLSIIYDTVEVEKDLKKDNEVFRPDVTIKDSSGKLKPILFEICNTSPCSTKKIEHCDNIVEIKIKDYSDLMTLMEKSIDESEFQSKVGFFNFRTIKASPSEFIINHYQYCFLSDEDKRLQSRYWRLCWYKSGKSFMEQILEDEIEKHRKTVEFEMVVRQQEGYYGSPKRYLYYTAEQLFPDVRRCESCSHRKHTWYGLEWCDIGKNGTSRKGTFDKEKATRCQYIELIKPNDEDKFEFVQIWQP